VYLHWLLIYEFYFLSTAGDVGGLGNAASDAAAATAASAQAATADAARRLKKRKRDARRPVQARICSSKSFLTGGVPTYL
jgi:hypothetical protein